MTDDQLPPGPYRKEITGSGGVYVTSAGRSIAYCGRDHSVADLLIAARDERDETPLDWEWLRQWADNNDVDALGFGNISAARMRREIVWLLIPEDFWPQTRGEFFTLCRQLRVELTPQSPAAQTPPPG